VSMDRSREALRGAARALLRLLLFAGVFGALAWLAAVLVPAPRSAIGALVWQGAIMLGAALAAGFGLLRFVDRRPASALGFAWTGRTSRELAAGFAIGIAAAALAVLPAVLTGAVRYTPTAGSATGFVVAMGLGLAVLALPAAAEEALFRGYAFQALVAGVGPVVATVVFSISFAAAHGSNPAVSGMALVNIFFAGVALSVAYLRTGSLWFATAVHLGWNWAVALPLDLPVSGLNVFDAPLYEPVAAGPTWFTGGAFGPEGGLMGTLGFALAVGMIWRWTDVAEDTRFDTD
jgi:membrane protease YdiL (CAAX protease family)